nr:N-6 DNA methylase [Providencia sp. wls1943]
MHLISKMRPQHEGGSRIGIILNGSPLFTGGAGSGESEIRRYILENDLLEAIVALPTDIFYNTGIATYIWVLSNHKPTARKGKVQLINASKERAKKAGAGVVVAVKSKAMMKTCFMLPCVNYWAVSEEN